MSNGGGQENIIERNQDKAVRRFAAFIGKLVDWIGKNVLPLSEPKQVNAFIIDNLTKPCGPTVVFSERAAVLPCF